MLKLIKNIILFFLIITLIFITFYLSKNDEIFSIILIGVFSFIIIILVVGFLVSIVFGRLLHWWFTKTIVISDDPDFYEPVASGAFMEKLLLDLKNRLSGVEMERIEKKFKTCFVKEIGITVERITYNLIAKFLLFSFISTFIFSFIGIILYHLIHQSVTEPLFCLPLSFFLTLFASYFFWIFFMENLGKHVKKY